MTGLHSAKSHRSGPGGRFRALLRRGSSAAKPPESDEAATDEVFAAKPPESDEAATDEVFAAKPPESDEAATDEVPPDEAATPEPAQDAPSPSATSESPRLRLPVDLRWPTVSGWFTFLSLLGLTAFVIAQVDPGIDLNPFNFHAGLLFRNTLTDGGDMGAHVYLPWFMRHTLLPQGRITGWSPGWYSGFPAFTFYFPLPSLIIALVSFVIPYTVAFKLVTASGLIIMPLCAWGMGKLAGWKPPVPVAMAAATLPLLFERSFTIDGGNIASTMAGEYSFALSLSLGLLLLGIVARGLRTGKHRALAAVLFAVVAMCHILPAIFIGVFAIFILALQMRRKRLWWGLSAGLAGVAITAVWLLPFEWRIGYSTNMGWSKVTEYLHCLFPGNNTVTNICSANIHVELFPFGWFVGLAGVGAVVSVVRWAVDLRRNGWGAGGPHRLGVVLTLGAIFSALVFRFAPSSGASSAIYNARAIPFWFLCIYLLGGVAIGEGAAGIGMLWRRSQVGRLAANWWIGADLKARADSASEPSSELQPGAESDSEGKQPRLTYPAKTWSPGALVGAVFVSLLALYYVSLPLSGASWLPGSVPSTDTAAQSFVPAWVKWNYSGYQSRATWPEYHALMTTMTRMGHRYGCGPAMWEYNSDENNFGTPMALMLLPYWTDGCVDSMEGLLFESASTTPFHFINQAELSPQPSEAMRDIPYSGVDVALGIKHLQMLGVRYFMTYSYAIQSQAMENPDLKLIATSGPWNGSESFTGTSVTWDIFLIENSNTVTAMRYQPAVMEGPGVSTKGTAWLDASMAWYTNPSDFGVPLVAQGPAGWQRVQVVTKKPPPSQPGSSPVQPVAGEYTTIAPPKEIPLPQVKISHLKVTSDSVSFDVNRTGVPVEVHTSYFPNWSASGARGPYHATPNEMIVVPTSRHVVVSYGYTPIDLISWLISLAGIAGALFMWRRDRLIVEAPGAGWWDLDSKKGREGPGQLHAEAGTSQQGGGRLDAIFKAYDLRGVVPDQFDYSIAKAVGSGFALFLKLHGELGREPRILVARDMRESGVELAGGFIAGVRSQGVDVVDLGLASTDMVYFASGKLDAPAAVFTASHNPARYNGIKFCLSGARPVGSETGLDEVKTIAAGVLGRELRDRSHRGDDGEPTMGSDGDWRGMPGVSAPNPGSLTSMNMLDAYAAHVRSFVDVRKLSELKVVADTANGMGGLVVPAVFSAIGAELEILFPELDGNFPNHPADPIQVENLADLVDRVVEKGADVGLAFDGDADRVFLVDETGEPLSGSLTTAMVASSMLAKHPGATVLYNLICSKAVPEVIEERGGTGIRTRVGHSFIKATMAETGAIFGGEHSGHYYFRENYRADSGLIAAVIVLEMMASEGKALSELRVPFERYAASGEINTEVDDPAEVIRRVEAHYGEVAPDATIDHLDGLTVDLGDWWFNLRPSNTEPLLRLNLEASSREECDLHVDEVLDLFRPRKARK